MLAAARPRGPVYILEVTSVVKIERVGFPPKVRDKEIQIAIVLDVDGLDAHACLRDSLDIERTASDQGLIGERTVTGVDPQLIHRAIVSRVDILAAIAIKIATRDAEAVAVGVIEFRLASDVFEGAIAAVSIQGIGRGLVGSAGDQIRSAARMKSLLDRD